MARLTALNPSVVTGKNRDLFKKLEDEWGWVSNSARTMAHSPAVLDGYLGLNAALEGALLRPRLRQLIAVMVANANGSEYNVAEHTAVGRMMGLSKAELAEARRGRAPDPRNDAVLKFARAVLEKRGAVSDAELMLARTAGISDRELSEVVAVVAACVFANYFNRLAQTHIDFPPVTASETAAA